MIRIDAALLAVEPLDMRAGTDTALTRVIKVFGAAHPADTKPELLAVAPNQVWSWDITKLKGPASGRASTST